MFVVQKGFAKWGLKPIGTIIGGVFVATLLISAITGGNMFQAWNVADITTTYFGIPQIATGVILTIVVGLVIIGGIKRIGAVAGRVVPFMCFIYVAAALYVLVMNLGEIPAMFILIVKSGLPAWLGGASPSPGGAFLGATVGYAAMWGIKRALFSSEAGQGSSPIAHSAAKTDEAVREGVVAGLEPFIDTIVVCTLTALVILSTGAYNRDADATFHIADQVEFVPATGENGETLDHQWTAKTPYLPQKSPEMRRFLRTEEGRSGWRDQETVFIVVDTGEVSDDTGRTYQKLSGIVTRNDSDFWISNWGTVGSPSEPTLRTLDDGSPDLGIYSDLAGASLTAHAFDRTAPGLGKWLVTIAAWLFAVSTMISWSYYGEQGVYFLCGSASKKTVGKIVLLYKLIYCLLILLTTVAAMPLITTAAGNKIPLIGTDSELDMWTTLGLGVMLVANIPIMLIFGAQAMKAYHSYISRLKSGELDLDAHEPASISDVMEGKDVE